jgi:transcriptional regulator with XRE-family HTH domain
VSVPAVCTPIDTELERISQRIRSWRSEQNLTLQELAQRSGLATSTIQKVETGQMIPSVAVLLKVARGLGRRATELVQDGDTEQVVHHVRAADRQAIGTDGKLQVARLSADLPEPSFEMWRVTLHPGLSSGHEAIQYDGEELAVCERGAVTFRIGEREYELHPGDTLHFKASIPHSWRNDSAAATIFTITGSLPQKFRALMQERVASLSTS